MVAVVVMVVEWPASDGDREWPGGGGDGGDDHLQMTV